ncbi:MAG: reactive intermediate/imine deaminase [Gammaproteobacteria bacterium]|jgi:reactive intermediate/imine deaminase
MAKTIVHTDKAPAAIGPYSQAVKVDSTVYISGQIPLDPASMEIVSGGIEAQITRVFDNLTAVSEAAGGSLKDIVKLNIFLTDLSNFPIVNEIMAKYCVQPYPARAAIEVSALPKGSEVEMDAILALD